MDKFVVTIKEDICNANGKDLAKQKELLSVITHYGTIEPFSKVEATIKADYQTIIDNLNAQLAIIKDQQLTADEIKLVKCMREIKAAISADYVAQVQQRDKLFAELKAQYDQTVEKIKAIIG